MALPFSLSDVDFGLPHAGPFKVGSAFYIVARDATTTTRIRVLKATDPSSSWSAQDDTNRPTNAGGRAVDRIDAVVDGTTIHIATDTSQTTGNMDLEYHTFSTASDTWGTKNDVILNYGIASTERAGANLGIAARASDRVVVYQGTRSSVMGTTYSRVALARGTAASWTVDIDLSAAAADKVAADFIGATCLLADSTNNRVHCFYFNSTDSIFAYDTYKSDNTFGHQRTSIDSAVGTIPQHAFVDGIAFTNTQRKVRASYLDSGGISIVGFDDADAPSQSIVATAFNDNANPTAVALAVDGTTQHALYTVSSSANIYHSETGAGNDTWATDDTELTVGTSPALVFTANIYDRGGTKLAYLLTDGGSEEYNERTFSTAVTSTGAQTLQLLTQAGVGVMDPEGTGAQTLQLLTQAGVGVMHPEGTGAQTLQLLVQAGTGALEISGTGAQTLEQLIQDATGTHQEFITSTGAQTLELLTQSGAGLEDIIGSSVQTLELLTQAGVGVMHPEGTGAQTLELLTQVGSGLEDIIGSAAQTLELLTQVGSGTHTPPGGPATGTGAQTLELLAQAGVGVMHPEGTGAQTLELLTQAASGVEEMSATAAQTLELLTQAGAGEQLNPIGAGAQTLQLLTQTASAIEAISGAGAQTLQLLTQDGVGTHSLSLTGTGAQTLQLLAQAGAGLEDISATAAQTLQLLTQAGAGEQLNPIGTGAQVLEILTQSANAQLDIIGSAAQTLQTLRQESSDFVPTAAQIMQVLTQNAQGVVLSIRLWIPETGITDTWVEEAPISNTWTEEGEL